MPKDLFPSPDPAARGESKPLRYDAGMGIELARKRNAALEVSPGGSKRLKGQLSPKPPTIYPSLKRPEHPLLRLQRTIGNRSVQRLIQRQSAAAEAPAGQGLTSPRFRGDPILEACFEDRARLTRGAKGDSVTKVQQALIDLHYDLGPTGADGDYGNHTSDSVKRFKADQKLGWETMGDVGPGTMHRLDELFPATEPSDVPPPKFAEEETQSCPTDDQIETAIQARPQNVLSLQDSGPAATPARTPSASPPAHVSIPEAVRRFKDKVNVSDVGASTNISRRGQFFWEYQMFDAITAELQRMRAEPTAATFARKGLAARDAIFAGSRTANALLAELDGIAARSRSPEKPNMLAILRGGRLGASSIESLLWAALNRRPDNKLPDLTPFRSLRTLQKLDQFDIQSCGFAAFHIAERLKQKGGISPRDTRVPAFSAHLAAGGGIRDRRPTSSPASAFEPAASAAVSAGSNVHLGDHIFQVGVSSALTQMRRGIDAGQIIHARVLSGVGYGTVVLPPEPRSRPFRLGDPPEEHSLLIIGYDGSQFVFFDPDSAVSSTPEAGFGMLFHDSVDDRFSTARSPASLPVDSHGKHATGDKRYQIISIRTE